MPVSERAGQAARPPIASEIISAFAKRWPYTKGRTRLRQLNVRALRYFEAKEMLRVQLSDSKLEMLSPWDDYCGELLVTFRDMDEDLSAFLISAFHAFGSTPSVFIDIGANLGVFGLKAAKDFGADVISYEPQPKLCELIATNAQLNGISDKITIRQVALTESAGELPFHIPANNIGNAYIATAQTADTINVKTVRLDRDVTPETWRRVKLIKIDVEGHEPEVFRGAAELFGIARPTIIFEVNVDELSKRNLKPRDVADTLRQYGYSEFFALGPSPYPIKNGMFIVSNVIAFGGEADVLRRAIGVNENYLPKPATNLPVIHYEF